jgi:hypothetical protein
MQQIEAFLRDHPEFEMTAHVAALPFRDQTDGAFAACLKKR